MNNRCSRVLAPLLMDKTLIEGRPFILPGIVGFPFTNGDTIGEDHHQSNLGTVGGVTVFAQSILTNGVFIDPSSDRTSLLLWSLLFNYAD